MKKQNPLPPPGVSMLSGESGYVPVAPRGGGKYTEAAKQLIELMRKEASEEVEELERGLMAHMTPEAPSSVKTSTVKSARGRREMKDVPSSVALPGRKRPDPRTFVRSVDGGVYEFKRYSIESRKREDLSADLVQMLLLTVAEIAKGGDPNPLLVSYGFTMKDVHGNTFYDWREVKQNIGPQEIDSTPTYGSFSGMLDDLEDDI